MVVQEKLLTVQEFDEFVMRPENADRLFEYIGGKIVVVFAPGSPARTLGINDTLDGGAVLPGFTLAVKAIFPE